MTIVHINKDSFPNSKLFPNKKVFLSITEPGTYILDEDIYAGSSTAGDHTHDNVLDFDRQVGPPPFHFGVWSIIAIECDNVILDLNGYKLAMTNNYAMQQRFFSLIELANQPFPTGKAGFTGPIKPANNVTIKNGSLSNSSHHCIHGNFNKNVYLENLVINDFEVAGIAINTGYNINIKDTKVDGTSTKIKVLASFAMVQDLKDSLKEIIQSEKYTEYHDMANKYLAHEVIQHILDNPGSDDYNITVNHPTEHGQVLDGNLFGIYFNNIFSVNELTNCGDKTQKINIDNVTIKDIVGNIHEVVGISYNNKCYKDNKGYIIQWDYIFDESGNVLQMDSQNKLARLFLVKLQLFCLKVLKNESTVLDSIIDFNKIDSQCDDYIDCIDYSKNSTHLEVYSIAGTDARGHIAKGNFGLRIDAASDVNINNVHIHNVKNYGEKGRKSDKTVYSEFPIGLNKPDTQVYKGASVTGLSLSYCDNVKINNSVVCKCKSANGFVIGVGLFNNTHDSEITNLELHNLRTVNSFETDLPNLKPRVFDGYIDPTCYYNTIVTNGKENIEEKSRKNNLLYKCGKCDKSHKQ